MHHRSVPAPAPGMYLASVRVSVVRFAQVRAWGTGFGVWLSVLFGVCLTANAQFKPIGPPPFSPTVARQKVKTLLEKVDPSNSHQTTGKLSELLAWYRDIIDEELIAAWRKDTRDNLAEVVDSLADSRVAIAVVNFSWREKRQSAFLLADAPMLGHLMVRFPESAKPFLDDLLGQPKPNLTEPEAEAVCRILMDMPDVGTWRNSALQILPHYRQAAKSVLAQDARGSDEEKRYQAERWGNDLKLDVPEIAHEQPSVRRRSERSPDRALNGDRVVLTPSPESDGASGRPSNSSQLAHTAAPAVPIPSVLPSEPTPAGAPAAPNPPPERAQVPSAPLPTAGQYSGPRSGTLEFNGNPVPQNAEYVFRNLPPVKIQIVYDTKIWDARLAPGEGETQRLIMKNKSSGPQKRCVVHWSVIP